MGRQALRVILWVNLASRASDVWRFSRQPFWFYIKQHQQTNWGELPSMAHKKWLFHYLSTRHGKIHQHTWGLEAQVGLYYLFQCWWRTNPNPIRDEDSDLIFKQLPFIVDFPLKMVIFHSYVKVYQRVSLKNIEKWDPSNKTCYAIVYLGQPSRTCCGELLRHDAG